MDRYLERSGFSQKKFASLLGVSVSTIANYLKGRRCPTLEKALKIEEFTGGKVTVKELNDYWKRKQNGRNTI